MTSSRAVAYRRVTQTLRDLGPAKLWPGEQDCIREAADALLFCQDLTADQTARGALGAVTRLADALIETERWTAQRVQALLDDIWACGPLGALDLSQAA